MSTEPRYRRILLKLSGEALMGDGEYGLDPQVLARVAADVDELCRNGIQISLVIGGGNIFRGAGLVSGGIGRVTGDHIGMLATVINALAMQEALESLGRYVRVMSAVRIPQVCEDFICRRAVRHLEKGRVCIFAAGTGNPFFTTDSAASLRAIEIKADLMVKATKVNGVYSADPVKHPEAERYDHLNYDQVITQKLAVMDATAVVLCRDHDMPLRVIDMNRQGVLMRTAMGENEGTLVDNGA